MEGRKREGLRVRIGPKTTAPPTPRVSNAERCWAYRMSIKADPEQYTLNRLKEAGRSKKNRQSASEEQKQRARDLARLRQQRRRERLRAEGPKKLDSTPKAVQKRDTRASRLEQENATQERRQKWRNQQRIRRSKWSTQKKRRHREKALAYYHAKKTSHTPFKETGSTPSTPPKATSESAARKAVSRVKKAALRLKPEVFGKFLHSVTKAAKATPRKRKAVELLAGSPTSKKIRENVTKTLDSLRKKRSKISLTARRLILDTVNEAGEEADRPSVLYQRKPSAKAVSLADFLDEVAIDLPGKATVSKRKMVQKKLLPKRVKRLHAEYNKTHPNVRVSRATFYRCIPQNFIFYKQQKLRQGLCEICVGIDKKLDVVNQSLGIEIDGRDVLSERSLCAVPKLDCYNRSCTACGVHLVSNFIFENLKSESNVQDTVVWEQWEMVDNANGKGKRKDIVKKVGKLGDLIESLLHDLESFSKHLLVFRWQYHQFRNCKSDVISRPNMALAICDFAENYVCKHQDEVQSAHWGYSQVTLHPTVTYYKCPSCDDMVTEYMVFVSDDLNKDACLAKSILDATAHNLQNRMSGNLTDLIVFSDGCAAQFKSKLPLYHLTDPTAPVRITRAYFGSRHGKSPCDSCGGVVKCLVDEDVCAGEVVVQNAVDFFDHCTANHVLPTQEPQAGECCHVKRTFHCIKSDEVDRSFVSSYLQTVPGTRSLHSVRGVSDGDRHEVVIQTRKLACFCNGCLTGTKCENADFVDQWETIKIKLSESAPLPHQGHTKSASPPPSCQNQRGTAPPQSSCQSRTESAPTSSSPSKNQRETASPTPFCPQQPVEEYFAQLHAAICECRTFDELQNVILNAQLPPLPELTEKTVVGVRGTVDKEALRLIPEKMSGNLFPVINGADGNCLPRCLSLFVYGQDTHHIEMRCRIVSELTKSLERYIQGEGMGGVWVVRHLAILAEGSGLTPESSIDDDMVRTSLVREIMYVRNRSINMGLWQLAAAASVLGVAICSVYPQKGWAHYQSLHNRILKPRFGSDIPVYIMWTTTRDDVEDRHWTANHFVPLMPINSVNDAVTVSGDFTVYNRFTLEDVAVGDQFLITWREEDYVCEITMIHPEGTIRISCMEMEKGLFFWPYEQDTSDESTNVLKERVHIELVASKSSQRKQFFKLV